MNKERDGEGFYGGFDAAADEYATAREAKIESRLREIDEGRVTLIPSTRYVTGKDEHTATESAA